MVNNDLWSPFDDREAEKIEKEMENLKVEAFMSFFDSKKLRGIKAAIRDRERSFIKYKSKKMSLDHVSCEGVASFSKNVWLISQCTKFKDGSDYDWEKYPISTIMEHYSSEQISAGTMRAIARREPWRSMWRHGKSSNPLGKSTHKFTKDQLSLCTYSHMYDNVYESMDSPNEKVIEDDDCLDGWFIVQQRKRDKDKKQHNPMARSTIQNRQNVINDADGDISFTKFHDVRQDIAMQSHNAAISKMKGGK